MNHAEHMKSIEAIATRQDLARYIKMLADQFAEDEFWQNRDLRSFLGALAAWTDDMDGYFKNMNQPIPLAPEWKTFAQMLTAARIYE